VTEDEQAYPPYNPLSLLLPSPSPALRGHRCSFWMICKLLDGPSTSG